VDTGTRVEAGDAAEVASTPAPTQPVGIPGGSELTTREGVLFAQRHAGNAAVARMLGGGGRAHLTDGAPAVRASNERNVAATGALRAAVVARQAVGTARTRLLQRSVVQEGTPGARPNTVAGDTGPGVTLLQRLLGVTPTGTFDQATRDAVDHFQRQQGWDPSGVGPMTWAALDDGAGAPGRRPNLNLGDRGPGVRLLQHMLGVQETSYFGHGTRAAVDQFQRQQGWEPSGVGPMTWAALDGHEGAPGRRPNLNLGDRGPGVRLLQRALGVPETALFDPATRVAADEFQRRQGWAPSGVGPMTWAELEHELNRLAVANRMGTMADPAAPTHAVWHPSGNDPNATDFSHWAMAATEDATFTVSATTVINCWEMVLYTAWKQGALPWSTIHAIYTYAGPTDWFVELANRIVRGGAQTWDRGTHLPRPRRGDVVMFDGANHVALATGVIDGAGTHTYSFWPPPDVSVVPGRRGPGVGRGLAGGTPDRVKDVTIELLAAACDDPASGHVCVVTFGPPIW
jgi:peptidoglycan hydrolase-like protein with peptidoglycan-binding domain